MKNKALTYVMLVVVAVIWYQVFFRVKSNLEGGDVAVTGPLEPQNLELSEPDTFRLAANYRDPFNARELSFADLQQEPEMPPVPAAYVPPMPKRDQWPKFRYYGLLRKTDSKDPLTILNIDGMQFSLRKGESVFDNYVLRQVYRDSVVFEHGRERRTFYKK